MTFDLFNAFATDTKAEEEGTWTQVPGAGDIEFLVARANNRSYAKLLQKMVKQNRAVLDSKGQAAEDKAEEILTKVMARTILLGWKGSIPFKGEKLDHSIENAEKLLSLKEFRAAVSRVADDVDVFKQVKEEEDLGN